MRALGESNAYVVIAIAMLVTVSLLVADAGQTAAQRTAEIISGNGDFLLPITVTGEVKKPGTFPVIDSPRLAQLLEMAGGLTGNAGPTVILVHFSDNVPLTLMSHASLVQLIRPGSAVPPNVTLTRIAVADNSGLNQQLPLAPQDILFVPGKNES